jgi:thiosulfate reductase cytochrome b subunit
MAPDQPEIKLKGSSMPIHPLIVRLCHWLNVIAVLIMITSGWAIYNASPIFSFEIPYAVTLGGWLAGALQWHFAGMWLFVLNGLVYVAYGIVSGHFRRKLLPISPSQVAKDILAAFRGHLAHEDLSVYNAAQRAAYLGLVLLLALLVATGLVLWKPVQFYWYGQYIGDYEGARYLHFFAMGAVAAIVLVHVLMVIAVPRTFPTMITGRLHEKA